MTAPQASPPREAASPAGPAQAQPGAKGPGGGSGSTHVRSGPRPAAVGRGVRLTAVLALLVACYAVVVAAVTGPGQGGYLDAESPGGAGSLALAQILRGRGITVSVAEARSTLRPEPAAPEGTGPVGDSTPRTVLVTGPDLLADTEIVALVQRVRAGSDVLLVAPSRPVVDYLAAMGIPIATAPPDRFDLSGEDARPGCTLPEATVAGAAAIGDAVRFTPPDDATPRPGQQGWLGTTPRLDLCYSSPEAARLAVLTPDGGPEVRPGPGESAGRLVLLGDGQFLTNARLDESGNAALALGLLSRNLQVDWVQQLVPSENPVGRQSLSDLLPDRFWVVCLQVLVLLMALAAWRGRRLGPPVAEPLPVVVRSAETVEGRGRLYAAGHARERAAEALRAGLRARLAERLGIRADGPPIAGGAPGIARTGVHEPNPGVLIAAVAEQTGRPAGDVGALLYGPGMVPPGYSWAASGPVYPAGGLPSGGGATGGDAAGGDAALVRLARELHELDRQVGRR
ncbi:DUF4350 domain-containing protein [Parafrankia sp. FMc2]|uniref:DUF4350 domain-containing protein n=1 Tax=Parafrankia sp. FMc2 TaxID=3233196 RepID=UPI0034D4DA2D